MQLFKDACRKKCCHFCILSLSQPQQFYYITSYQKGYFTINSYNLNFVNVDDCNIYAEFAKNVDLLAFGKDIDFYKGFHCTMMVLSSYSKLFSIKYLPQVGRDCIAIPAKTAMV